MAQRNKPRRCLGDPEKNDIGVTSDPQEGNLPSSHHPAANHVRRIRLLSLFLQSPKLLCWHQPLTKVVLAVPRCEAQVCAPAITPTFAPHDPQLTQEKRNGAAADYNSRLRNIL